MQDGETIEVVAVAQLKRGMKRRLGKNLATGLATGLVTTVATGGVGAFVYTSMPAAWVVVTSQRVLMYAKKSSGSKPGELVFEAPREALTAGKKIRLLIEITVADRSDGQSLVRLNLGWRRKSANRIIEAIER